MTDDIFTNKPEEVPQPAGAPPGVAYVAEGTAHPGDGTAWIGDIVVDPNDW